MVKAPIDPEIGELTELLDLKRKMTKINDQINDKAASIATKKLAQMHPNYTFRVRKAHEPGFDIEGYTNTQCSGKPDARIERELARAKVSSPLQGTFSMPSSALGQSSPEQPTPILPSPVQPLSDQPTPPEKKKRGRPRKPSRLSLDDLTRMEAVAQKNKKTIQQATRLREFIGGAWKEGSPLYFGAPSGIRLPQDEAEQQLANLVDTLQEEGPPDQDLKRILDRCEKFRDQWFTYLRYPGMPPNNNQAERDLRPWAVQRKVSGGFQSEHVVRSYLTYKSLFATCQKNDKDFQALLRLLLNRQKVDLLDFFFSNGARPAASAPVLE